MASERGKRRIERLLDEADEAVSQLDWETVRDRAQAALVFDPDNSEALELLSGAERGGRLPTNGFGSGFWPLDTVTRCL